MVGGGLANMIGMTTCGGQAGAGGGGGFTNLYSTEYDGVDDRVDISNSLTTTTGTYSVWVKPDLTNDRWVIASDGGIYRTYVGVRTLSNGKVRAQLTISHSTKWKLETDSAVLNASSWTHIALTQNGTEPKLYIDGIAVAQTFVSSADKTAWWSDFTTTRTRIGAFIIQNYSNLYWKGKADEVSIYTTALTQTDITAIYNSGTPDNVESLSPLNWLRFEEGSGTTAIDSGSGGNNGTLINGVAYSTDVP